MRIIRFVCGWAATWLVLYFGTGLVALSLGWLLPPLLGLIKMPIEIGACALVFAGVIASMEERDWTFGPYMTLGACLGSMASIFAGAWVLGDAALASRYSLLIIGGVTLAGVALGTVALVGYRIAAGPKGKR